MFLTYWAFLRNKAVVRAVFVPVAQLDRVLASEAKGCAFESRRGYFLDFSNNSKLRFSTTCVFSEEKP